MYKNNIELKEKLISRSEPCRHVSIQEYIITQVLKCDT